LQFSIITVCYNAGYSITKTITSVLDQEEIDYEYIIIDGKSSDNTLEIAYSYKLLFKEKGISYTIISEKDSGIYNAMNKALDYSNGAFIFYLNSGDTFYNNQVLKNVKQLMSPKYCVYYGDTASIGKSKKILPSGKIEELRYRLPFCHQSVFTSSELMKLYKFDEYYNICADYDFFVKIYLNYGEDVFNKVDSIISNYMEEGFSTTDGGIKARMEMAEIRKNNHFISVIEYRLIIFKLKVKKIIKGLKLL